MASQLKIGDKIRGYEMTKEVTQGGFANSFFAKDSSGTKVFFKQYTNPTPFVPWFNEYFDYQQELKNRLESVEPSGSLQDMLEHFIEDEIYYQVLKLINGKSLQDQLDDSKNVLNDEERGFIGTVMMFTIKIMHEKGLVHSDLKPDNVFLEEDKEIKLRWKARLIDFDFSLIENSPPPWVDDIGYVGTRCYFSPEHLNKQMPQKASDIFTCGLILYEILAGEHPYPFGDEDEYKNSILNYTCKKPNEYNPELSKPISETLYNCLNPDPDKRPSASELHKSLLDYTKLGGMI